jgi:hypothetical protein
MIFGIIKLSTISITNTGMLQSLSLIGLNIFEHSINVDRQHKRRLNLFYFLTASDQTLGSDTYAKYPFYFGQMTMSNGLIAFCSLCGGSISGTPWISKSFILPTFWLLNSASRSRAWLKQKGIFLWRNESSH